MRPRTVLVLALLAAGLGAFIWFVDRDLPSSEERAERGKRLVALEAEEIEGAVLEWGDQRVELARVSRGPRQGAAGNPEENGEEDAAAGEGTWRLESPLEARADEAAVEALVESLVSLEKKRTVTDVERADAGLEPPRAVVTLITREGETRLEIGAEVPGTSSMVVAVAGRPEIYVAPNAPYADLTREPGDWRSKDLFSGQRDSIERLTLQAGSSRVFLARRGEEFWIESPLVDRADREAVSSLLGSLLTLRADAFVDPADVPAELGLEPPAAVVEVVLASQLEPFRLELGAASGTDGEEVYARAGGQVVRLRPGLSEALGRSAQEWRSRRWSRLQVYQIDAAEVRRSGGAALRVERSGADWERDGKAIPFSVVTDFLYSVADAEATSLVDPPPSGGGLDLGAPRLEIVLQAGEGGRETLQLFAERSDGVPARASDREVLLILPSHSAREIGARLEALETAEPVGGEETVGAEGGEEDAAPTENEPPTPE